MLWRSRAILLPEPALIDPFRVESVLPMAKNMLPDFQHLAGVKSGTKWAAEVLGARQIDGLKLSFRFLYAARVNLFGVPL